MLIALGVELLVAVCISAGSKFPSNLGRRAFLAWQNNPTPETKAELDRQRSIMRWEQIRFGGWLFIGMAGVTIPIIAAISRRTRNENDNTTRNAA